MRIDITSPEGNTLVALGLATRALRQTGTSSADISALRTAVMWAGNPESARRIIEDATHGAITFFDPRDE